MAIGCIFIYIVYRIMWYLYVVILLFYLGCMHKHITCSKDTNNQLLNQSLLIQLSILKGSTGKEDYDSFPHEGAMSSTTAAE